MMAETHHIVDALRWFDIVLAVVLAGGLTYEWLWHYNSRPKPYATLVAVGSWFLLNLSGLLTSIARMGEPGDARLPIRLAGHMLGVVFVAVAVTMRQRGERPLRDTEEKIT